MVVDLPGEEAVHVGLALAQYGYRPIPLFNACTAPMEVIDQTGIQRALSSGAEYLRDLHLPAAAPPAFLLDQRRRTPERPIRAGAFDNRWRVFPEDFPSEDIFLFRGFTQVVLVQQHTGQPQSDLALVLYDWQSAGLRIVVKKAGDDSALQPLTIRRPSWLRILWQRLFGGSRSDGFGYRIPEPTHG